MSWQPDSSAGRSRRAVREPLAAITERRLAAAGLGWDNPAMARIREHNTAARERAGNPCAERPWPGCPVHRWSPL